MLATSDWYCATYCVRSVPTVLLSASLTSTSRALLTVLEMSVSAETVVESNPCTLPSCWLALISAPVSERTRCAIEKAAPSSTGSATRNPVETCFCTAASCVLVSSSDSSAMPAATLVLTEFKAIVGFPILLPPVVPLLPCPECPHVPPGGL